MKCCKCFKNEDENRNRPWCDWRNVQIYFCVCYNTAERQTDEPRTDNSQTVQPIQQTSQGTDTDIKDVIYQEQPPKYQELTSEGISKLTPVLTVINHRH